MKRTALLLTMVMALVMIFALSGCSLDATLTQGTFVEDTFVEDLLVESYNINFVVNGETTTVTCKQGLVPTAPAVENYETDSKSYTFIGWDKPIVAATEDATYTAIFSGSTKIYEVTFIYGTLESQTLQLYWGADVKGEAPTSGLNYQTIDKVYTFTGWDKELVPVNGDAFYIAQYDATARKYNVRFVYGTGSKTVETEYGALPVAPTEGDFDYMTESTVYTFKGWEEVVEVTGEAEYHAIYDESPREYTITFIYDGKTETATFKYGETVVLPTPAGYSDAAGSYAFKAWDKEAAAVTGEATYTAEYDMTAKVLYTQNFNDKDFDQVSTSAANVPVALDSIWTITLQKGTTGGAYAKTVIDANDPNNKYVVAGILEGNAATAQLNAKDASKKGGEGSLAAMGDFTKLTFSVDIAAKEGVDIAKGYIRFRGASTSNVYVFFAHNRDDNARGDEIKFNGKVVDGVAITTTMQTFTFEFDFAAGTASLLVDGVTKVAPEAVVDMKMTIAECKEYLFNWAFEDLGDQESALIIDNLSLVAHN